MAQKSGSLLTPTQREWLADDEHPSDDGYTRSAIYARLRAMIDTDGKALAEALGSGELNEDTVVKDLTPSELAEGISGLVAVLYILGDAKAGFAVEGAIQTGMRRGREGYIESIEEKIERDGIKSLTVNEMLDLRSEKPEKYRDRINLVRDQIISDNNAGMFGPEDDITEEFDIEDE